MEKIYPIGDDYPKTPEMNLILRIVSQWGNVVEMPNMEGWLKEYATKQAPTGAVWVKASEFRTTVPIYRPYRKRIMEDEGEYYYGQIYVAEDDGHIYLNIDNESNFEIQSDAKWDSYEILDESATHWRPLPEPPKQS